MCFSSVCEGDRKGVQAELTNRWKRSAWTGRDCRARAVRSTLRRAAQPGAGAGGLTWLRLSLEFEADIVIVH